MKLTDDECWARVNKAQEALFPGDAPVSLGDVQKLLGFMCFAAFHASGLDADEAVDPMVESVKRCWPLLDEMPTGSNLSAH